MRLAEQALHVSRRHVDQQDCDPAVVEDRDEVGGALATLEGASSAPIGLKLEDGSLLMKSRSSPTEAWRLWNFRP